MSRDRAVLEVRGLHVAFAGAGGPRQAVQGVDFDVLPGQCVALVGESGSGKSTTALAIMGLLPPNARSSGQVRFGGRDLLELDETAMSEVRGRAISMIFQEPMTALNPVQTAGWQIAEVLRRHQGLDRRAADRRALELLDLVRIPEPQRRQHDYPHQLSGGQRQRVMIAMAVACRPRLLVADEPTTALDVTVQAQILELLDQLRGELSMAVLLITHDLGVVGDWTDRILVMHGGRVLEHGTTAAIFERPCHPYTRGLLEATLRPGRELHYRSGRLPQVVVDTDPAGGEPTFRLEALAALRPRAARDAAHASAACLLDVHRLTVRYASRHGAIKAVDEVSFQVGAGEIVGLVGGSGCGKSSLSKALVRFIPSDGGRILLEGTDITALTPRAMRPWRKRIQMVFQDPYASLNPRYTVGETLAAALQAYGVIERGRRDRSIHEVLERVGLVSSAASRYPHEFSGGQRQRIGIARALAARPALIILDEAVSALDVSVRAQILNLLVDLKDELGLSYLFISHDLSVVRYIADRVLVMQGGRIVESGTTQDIWHAPRHAYTRSLLDAIPGGRGALRTQRPAALACA